MSGTPSNPSEMSDPGETTKKSLTCAINECEIRKKPANGEGRRTKGLTRGGVLGGKSGYGDARITS